MVESSTTTASELAFMFLELALGYTGKVEPEVGIFSSQIENNRECRAALV